MATVSREFRRNFETFAQHRIDTCQFTLSEVEDLRKLVRIDLMPGPDQLRGECEFLTESGVKIPAVIDDAEERYRIWDAFFADECETIHQEKTGYIGAAIGINQRIRAQGVEEMKEAA